MLDKIIILSKAITTEARRIFDLVNDPFRDQDRGLDPDVGGDVAIVEAIAEVRVGVVREEGTNLDRDPGLGQDRNRDQNPDRGLDQRPDLELDQNPGQGRDQSPDRDRGQNPNRDLVGLEEHTHVPVLDLEGVRGRNVNAEGRSRR